MAKKRRETRRQNSKKQQQRMYFGITAVAAVVVALVIIVLNSQSTAPIPEGVAQAYAGLEQGVDAQGFPRLGQADAPIVVEEYSSFGCSACKSFHDTVLPRLFDSLRAGDVQLVYKPITMIANDQNNFAGKAARASICAVEQGKFWEMHDVAFHWQGEYKVSSSAVEGAANAIGMDPDALVDCYNSNAADGIIVTAEREFRERNYSGTPTLLLNGKQIENWTSIPGLVDDLVN